MDVKIEQSWKERLSSEFEKDYFSQLITFVKEEYRQRTIYPPGPCIFSAFEHCPFDKVKVVILGQHPYHEPGQAHGLCFSVQDGSFIMTGDRNCYFPRRSSTSSKKSKAI